LKAGTKMISRRLTALLSPLALARGLSSTTPIKPVKYLALRYKYVEDVLERRGPFREEHIANLQKMSDEGKCVLGGAFNDPADGAVVLFDANKCSKRDVEQFAKVRLSFLPSRFFRRRFFFLSCRKIRTSSTVSSRSGPSRSTWPSSAPSSPTHNRLSRERSRSGGHYY